MIAEDKLQDLLAKGAKSLDAAPSMADEVICRIHAIRAGGQQQRSTYRVTLRERIFLMKRTQKIAAAILVAIALAATAWAAEKVVEFVLEGRPVKVKCYPATQPTIVIVPSDGNSGRVSGVVTGTGTGTVTITGTSVFTGTAVTEATSSVGAGQFTREQVIAQIDKLIAQKKYKLVSKAETPAGTECKYRFELSDGTTKDWLFFLPLDDVKSYADYAKKYQQYEPKRQEAMHKALAKGRYRLINIELLMEHVCTDVASGRKIRVVQIRMPDGSEIASARLDEPVAHPESGPWEETQYETSWQEHLDLIKAGKRKLLDAHVVKDFWYEMTLDDGSKSIIGIGGQEPLGKPAAIHTTQPAQPAAKTPGN